MKLKIIGKKNTDVIEKEKMKLNDEYYQNYRYLPIIIVFILFLFWWHNFSPFS
jgi:hypothetical protein